MVCVSQPTRVLLEEAAKQRRYWWHQARSGSSSRVKSFPRSASLFASTGGATSAVENLGTGAIDRICGSATTEFNSSEIPPCQTTIAGQNRPNDGKLSRLSTLACKHCEWYLSKREAQAATDC